MVETLVVLVDFLESLEQRAEDELFKWVTGNALPEIQEVLPQY